ncbi:Protein root UVB sensitive 2, chloroplastic [Gracilariopsis chorda]|uniref:Protein root UVB sensitive 2, chloroplastic n=1 Tax=Gracilariopsis chorda TaxID=448386 RepID=A0A2V3IGE1_9FLOR|nr:Protein root UVB sensitive 2, chloroplastic [Gracilariopsis chorda]|eukprot:PXF41139.1 Protein root UVB sensitive 2, chloroplastic [Gracilariopsis chorda]
MPPPPKSSVPAADLGRAALPGIDPSVAAFISQLPSLPVRLTPCSSLSNVSTTAVDQLQPHSRCHSAPSRHPPLLSLRRAPSIHSQTPCTVLWLRSGNLRLSDNPAAIAASTTSGFLLALITLPDAPLSPLTASAVADLSRLLRLSHQAPLVRHTSNELTTIAEVARTVRARTVLAMHPCSSAQHVLRTSGITLRTFESPGRLYDAPQTWPPPPPTAHHLRSDISLHGLCNPGGETVAQRSLTHKLSFPNMTLSQLFVHFREHLCIGTITKLRIQVEFSTRHISIPKFHTNSWHQRVSASLSAFFAFFKRPPAVAALSIVAYDVNGGDRRGVEWDESTQSFVLQEWEHQETERQMQPKQRVREFIRRRRMFFHRAFFPEDVTPDYYSFSAWRFAQRCFSATVGVFGTSSLLFALGIRSGRIGQAAVISWVLKDGLGRVGKMVWAGSMGKDFDVDPKRWRFRSALLYAFGNGLEIVTQIFPASFLLFATAANSMKQVSMLTASATRNAMYRSFGERTQNIANITAKGEAQIVVADLIGMATGIQLSKIVTTKAHILGTYVFLTVLDIFGIYMELRQVVFRTLNAERSSIVLNHYVRKGECLAPSQVSPKERIFLKEKYKSRVRLSSIAKAAKNPDELQLLLSLFRREHFIVTMPRASDGGACRLVLRKDATNEDVLRAMLMAEYVHQAFKKKNGKKAELTREDIDSILRNARKNAKRVFPSFLRSAREAGWNTDNLLFSTLKRRGYWRHT